MAFLVGLVACAAALAGCASADRPALDDDSTRDEFGRIVEPGDVGGLRLRVGDCFISGEDEVEYVVAVPCATDHNSEVIAVFDLADTAWPGATAVEQAARSGCLERFDTATGFSYDLDLVVMTALAPTATSWTDDRSVICVAEPPDGSMVRGALTAAGA